MPCALAFFFLATKEKKFIPVVCIGILSAMLYAIIRLFFFYPHRIIHDSITANFIYYFARLVLIPNLVVYGLYVLLTKDRAEFKIKSYLPLMLSFYAVLIPYNVIAFTQSYVFSGYDIFLKPILYLSMLIEVYLCLVKFYNIKTNNESGSKNMLILIMIVYLIFPALVDTLYAVNKLFPICVILSIPYVLLPALTSVKIYKESKGF